MAAKVPRMLTPNPRQLVGTRGGIRLEEKSTLDASLIDSLTSAIKTINVGSVSTTGIHIVTYVATGAEGANFMVPIGATLTGPYAVAWAPAGIQNVPLIDLPAGVGDHLPDSFRVLNGGLALQAGETFTFIVFETTSVAARIVTYVVTGAEGANFIVPIGATLSDDDYSLIWSPTGLTTIPLLDLPTGPTNRTTTGFRVLVVSGALTPGDTLTFFLFEP